MSDVVCDFLVPLDSFETKPTFLLEPESCSIHSRKHESIRHSDILLFDQTKLM